MNEGRETSAARAASAFSLPALCVDVMFVRGVVRPCVLVCTLVVVNLWIITRERYVRARCVFCECRVCKQAVAASEAEVIVKIQEFFTRCHGTVPSISALVSAHVSERW